MDITPLHRREPGQSYTCDFCNEPGAVTLDVPDFVMGNGFRSTEGWVACVACALMVHNEDINGLLARAKKSEAVGRSDFAATGELEKLHGRFWHAWHKRKLEHATAAANAFVTSVKSTTPPWTEAIEAQFEALKTLEKTAGVKVHSSANDANDLATLRIAETYSFSGHALEAILQLTEKVPHDSPLHPEQIPGIGQGWWWFTPPLELVTNIYSKQVHGVLWGFVHPKIKTWNDLRAKYQKAENAFMIPAGSPIEDLESILSPDDVTNGAFVTFTAFAYSEMHGRRILLPSTSFRWFLNETVHEMLTRNALEYRQMYGPDGKMNEEHSMGETHHLKVVSELGLFFLSACMWLEQDYLEVEHKHIERHRRKAFIREHKLDRPPVTVRVIALRKRRASDSDDPVAPGEKTGHQLTVQFICSGHPRLQRYGPGRTMKKLIYIAPFRKGPVDAPFKSTVKKVYAVIR
jgi:hypothetical protein